MLQEAYRLQLRCFLGLVHEQRHLPMLKELLQLYTAVSLRKLASLMDLDEATVRGQLMLLKARLRAGPDRPLCFDDCSGYRYCQGAGRGITDASTMFGVRESNALHSIGSRRSDTFC